MRCNLLICVLLAAMLVEASCFSAEEWQIIRTFWKNIFWQPSCIVPEPPNGGRIAGGYPGDIVPLASQLTYSCTDGYIMYGSGISTCYDGVWHNTPTCSRPVTKKQDLNWPDYL